MLRMRCRAGIRFKEYDEIVLVPADVCASAKKGLESRRQVVDLRAADVRVIERAVAFRLRAKIAGVAAIQEVLLEGSIGVSEPRRRTIIPDGRADDNSTPPVADFAVRAHRVLFNIHGTYPLQRIAI